MSFIEKINNLAKQFSELNVKSFTPEPQEKGISREEMGVKKFGIAKGGYIRAHFEKIRASDLVLIANYPKNGIEGYIGPNSLIELAFGYALSKKLYLLFEPGEQPCKPEILGMQPMIINGDIDNV